MTFKYLYLFPIIGPNGVKIVYSCETAETLRNRVKKAELNTDGDRQEVDFLIERNHQGSYYSLSTGEFIIQIG